MNEKLKYIVLLWLLAWIASMIYVIRCPSSQLAMFCIFIISFLPLLLIFKFASDVSHKVGREEFLEQVRIAVNGGPITIPQVVYNKNSYQFSFIFNERLYVLEDLLYKSVKGKSAAQNGIEVVSKVSDNLTIIFFTKYGTSFISWICERLADLYYIFWAPPITDHEIKTYYPELRIYSNQPELAIRVLKNPMTVNAVRELYDHDGGYPSYLPFEIRNGCMRLYVYKYLKFNKDPQVICEYLKKVAVIADAIDSFGKFRQSEMPDITPETKTYVVSDKDKFDERPRKAIGQIFDLSYKGPIDADSLLTKDLGSLCLMVLGIAFWISPFLFLLGCALLVFIIYRIKPFKKFKQRVVISSKVQELKDFKWEIFSILLIFLVVFIVLSPAWVYLSWIASILESSFIKN